MSTESRTAAIDAIASGRLPEEVADAAGIDVATLDRWLADKPFCEALHARESHLYRAACRARATAIANSWHLLEAVTDPDKPTPSTGRIAAAKLALSKATPEPVAPTIPDALHVDLDELVIGMVN